MKTVIIIVILLSISISIVLAISIPDFSDSDTLQNVINECTKIIDNIGPSDRNLENCLDDAYNQYGSEEQKQSWFDAEH
ncbi:hypothetical protein JYT57_00405 [Nitrosarchaeum koreense]|nr:hypothetical protein [Nitrosarchaeum koreense]